ncbi:MAG: DUF4935 domain-containing protein [Polyangiaceae bacterium]|nr:DUF4935 domain-containing protein [Polyangiaceae bacterium]
MNKAPQDPPFQPYATSPERVFTLARKSPDPATALIVLDTNVLLAPYRASTEALTAIQGTYAKLRSEGRLVVPGQVAREFARNRPTLLSQLHKSARDSRSISINGRLEYAPILAGTPEYLDAQKHYEDVLTTLKACRAAIDKLVDRIESWQFADPVLDVYRQLLDSTVVKELSLDTTTLESIRKARYEARIPPGFRDKGKDDQGVGDLAIWMTLLEVASHPSQDAIFVTEDSKDDWFHRSGDNRLFPRYELVEEFAERTSGKAFGIESLSSLLKRHGAAPAVVQEVTEQEAPNEVSIVGPRQVLERARDAIMGRLVTVPNMRVNTQRSFPDLIIERPDALLGIEILPIMGPSSLRRSLTVDVDRARREVHDGRYDEVALLFVAYGTTAASALEHKLADVAYFSPGLVPIAARLVDRDLVVILNHSKQQLLQDLLPVRA